MYNSGRRSPRHCRRQSQRRHGLRSKRSARCAPVAVQRYSGIINKNINMENLNNAKKLNIVVPMAGKGSRFQEAGYTFPKPLIYINGKTRIEVAVNNLKPKVDYKFIFICQREHFDKYDLYHILQNATDNKFEVVVIDGITEGAACTILCAVKHINNDN